MKNVSVAFVCVCAAAAGALAQEPAKIMLFDAIQARCASLLTAPREESDLKRLAELGDKVEDPELKAALSATCLFGRIYIGKLGATDSPVRNLQKAFPASPHMAIFQMTNYLAACAECSGQGFQLVDCKNCKGSGTCPACKGSGAIETIGGKTEHCIFCRGAGRCPKCGGAKTEKQTCQPCMGKGRVLSRALMLEAYLEMLRKTKDAAFAAAQAEKGLVALDGKWVTHAEKDAEEMRRFAEAQSAKGLVEFNGKWVAPEEKKLEEERLFREEQAKKGLAELDGKWMTPQEREMELEKRAGQAQAAQTPGPETPEPAENHDPKRKAELAKARKAAGVSDIVWSELAEIYGANSRHTEVRKRDAWKKYGGKKIEWTGRVAEVSKNWDIVDVQVKMQADSAMPDVLVTLKKSESEKALSFSKGDRITFRGALDGWGAVFPVSVKDAEIVKQP